MEGLEFHCDSLGFISEAAALPLFSLSSQLRPVLISSSCYSSRISTQSSSGKGTGGGVCCALECLGKYLLLKCIIWIGMSKVCPAQSQNPTVPGSGSTGWDKSSSSENLLFPPGSGGIFCTKHHSQPCVSPAATSPHCAFGY